MSARGSATGQRQHVDTEIERHRGKDGEREDLEIHTERQREGRWQGKDGMDEGRRKNPMFPQLIMTSSVFLSSAESPFSDPLLSPWYTISIHTHTHTHTQSPMHPCPILSVSAK